MDFHIGARIVNRDGENFGKLTHVIVDPETKEVIELVLGESGLLGRDVIVPIGAVNGSEPDEISVELSKEQAEKLQPFAVSHYVSPDIGATPGFPNGALMTPGMAPVGAAAGLETIAFTPIVEVTEQIPDGDVDLQPGTEVWATDDMVGHIRDVLVDEQTNRVRGFVVEKGILFHKDYEITLDQVAAFGTDRVTLNVAKNELKEDE